MSTTNITADHNNSPRVIIDDVDTISTGILNVDLLVKELGSTKGSYNCPTNEVYTLYKDNGAIIAVVAIGEDNGAGSELVFITGNGVNQEDDNGNTGTKATGDGKYTWYLKAIVAGEDEERSITEVGNNASILKKLARNTWYELRFDADGNVRKVDEDSAVDANNDGYYDGIDFSKAKFLNAVTGIVTTVPNEDTVLVQDKTTVTALRYVGNTLYTTTNDSRGFPVAEDVEVFLVLAGGKGNGRGADWFDDVRDEYHGASGLKSALDDMNATNKNPLPTVTLGNNVEGVSTSTTVQVSAVLKNGVATTVIINDLSANPAKNPGTPGIIDSEYDPEVELLPGNVIQVKANVDPARKGDEVVMISAWNWLYNNGYRVMSYTNNNSVGNNWTFTAVRDNENLPIVFTTRLVSVTGVYINNVRQWITTGSSYTFAGDYRTKVAATYDDAKVADKVPSGDMVMAWNTNGKHFIDGLYKVTLDHDGNGAGTNTDVYYKMGETIKTGTAAGELQGNWYIVDPTGAANKFTKAANATDYAKFQPTKDLVMSEALKDKVIYDKYYSVKANANLGGTHAAVDEFVLGTTASSELGGSTIASLYAKSNDGKYVKLHSDQTIQSVDADYNIVDAGYALVDEIVTVTDTSVTTQLAGMTIIGSVAPNTYVKANEGTVTVKLSLAANGNKAAGKIDLGAVKVGATSATATVAGTTELIDNNTSVLEVTEITINVPASFTTVTSGKVAVEITPAVGS